jgi:transposase InsO family protein
LFPDLNIPESTIRGWLRGDFKPADGMGPMSRTEAQLHAENAKLRRRVRVLQTIMCLLLVLVRITGCRLDGERLPDGMAKRQLLQAIGKATKILALVSVLKVIGLSTSRFHGWYRRGKACSLTDRRSCPKKSPGQLTATEVEAIRQLATSEDYRHMPTSTLSRFAQRTGKVYASASTWLRLIRERGWRRPRTRVHLAKPKVGIRASKPDEIWHMDVTVIRLLNGTKLYLHGVVDNFSRRLLAWKLVEQLSPTTTCEVLAEAAKHLSEVQSPVTLLADSGVENVNGTVDQFLFGGVLKRVLAQVEIVESNSAVEVWWRGLKNHWLYLNTLDSEATVRRLVAFYVQQYNEVMPHSALDYRTRTRSTSEGQKKSPSSLRMRAAWHAEHE